jgi:hypothetical protein
LFSALILFREELAKPHFLSPPQIGFGMELTPKAVLFVISES